MIELGETSPPMPVDRVALMVVLAAALAGLAVLIPVVEVKPLLFGASAGFLALLVLKGVQAAVSFTQRSERAGMLDDDLGHAAGTVFLTNEAGRVLSMNRAAADQHSGERPEALQTALARLSVEPSKIVSGLIDRVQAAGAASEIVGIGAARTRLEVNRVTSRRYSWSLCPDPLDPELALVSVRHGAVSLNEAALKIFPENGDAVAECLQLLSAKQGACQRVRRTDGGMIAVRLLEIQRFGESADIAVIPLEEGNPEPQGTEASALAAPDLLNVLPVPMLKVDASGNLLEVNQEARAILALKDESLPPLFELVEGMGRPISDWLGDAAHGRGLLKPEIVRAVIPGQELYLQITLGRTFENGQTVLVGILNDATELKTLEAQFVQSQKMQAIGQLAGGVAHDFNNLLTAISGHCDLLLLRHDASDPDYADLIQISQNSNRAASLVGQLLAFSRKQNLKPQALDLRDTMADLAHLLNRLIGERVQLEVRHAPGPQMIRADRRQLEQVIVNLVVNARDAMKDGGKIEVVTRSEFLTEEVSRDRARLTPGDYVVIEVRDTGCGIPPEALSKIFEPFFSTKKTGEGTGLGLSTAYGIVKQTGGYIFVDSTPDEGTVFSLYFPATTIRETPPAEQRATAPSMSAARGDATILLVEDEAPVRAFACRALRLRGYTVIEAGDAEEALSILADKALKIDLFVTDVIMPGLDGPTWVRQALRDRPETHVVFMSGYAEEGRAEKQARIPNSVFLPKPFSLQQLTALVQEQLG